MRRILIAAFDSNDFDSFELKLDLVQGEVVPFETSDSAGVRRNTFRWTKAGSPKTFDGSTAWNLVLNLVSSTNRRRGTLTVQRLYSSRDLQIDINLLTSAFPTALTDALDRTLAHSSAHHRSARTGRLADLSPSWVNLHSLAGFPHTEDTLRFVTVAVKGCSGGYG